MIKTVTMAGQDVNFSTSFAWTFHYKSQFGSDPIRSLLPAVRGALSGAESTQEQGIILLEELGVTGVAEIAWAMARTADKNVKPPLAWIGSFGDDFPVMDLLSEVVVEAIVSCFATKKAEAPDPAEPTTETKM